MLLILKLQDPIDQSKITFTVPDIFKIDQGELANDSQEKFYLRCINRPPFDYQANEKEALKRQGYKVDEKKLIEALMFRQITYRLIFNA